MFEAYRESRSLRVAAKQANAAGHRTKSYKSRSGRRHGGNLFTQNAVWQVVRNPIYLGKVRLNGQTFKGRHEPLVGEKLWHEIQEILKDDAPNKSPFSKPRVHAFLLADLGYCGLCGASLIPHYVKARGEHHYYYRCRAKYNGGENCSLPVVRADQLEELVVNEVRRIANSPDLLAAALEYAKSLEGSEAQTVVAQLHGKEGELAKLEAEERNLLAFIKSGGLEEKEGSTPEAILEELRAIRRRIAAAKEQLPELEARAKSARRSAIDPAAISDSLAFFDTVFDLLGPEEKASLLKTFVQRVNYTPKKVQIFLFNEPLDEKMREDAVRLLREPKEKKLLAPPGSPGFLGCPEWLPG